MIELDVAYILFGLLFLATVVIAAINFVRLRRRSTLGEPCELVKSWLHWGYPLVLLLVDRDEFRGTILEGWNFWMSIIFAAWFGRLVNDAIQQRLPTELDLRLGETEEGRIQRESEGLFAEWFADLVEEAAQGEPSAVDWALFELCDHKRPPQAWLKLLVKTLESDRLIDRDVELAFLAYLLKHQCEWGGMSERILELLEGESDSLALELAAQFSRTRTGEDREFWVRKVRDVFEGLSPMRRLVARSEDVVWTVKEAHKLDRHG